MGITTILLGKLMQFWYQHAFDIHIDVTYISRQNSNEILCTIVPLLPYGCDQTQVVEHLVRFFMSASGHNHIQWLKLIQFSTSVFPCSSGRCHNPVVNFFQHKQTSHTHADIYTTICLNLWCKFLCQCPPTPLWALWSKVIFYINTPPTQYVEANALGWNFGTIFYIRMPSTSM